MLLEDCLTKRYTRQGLPPPVPLAEVFEECPGNFFRLGSDIGPQFYSTMYAFDTHTHAFEQSAHEKKTEFCALNPITAHLSKASPDQTIKL